MSTTRTQDGVTELEKDDATGSEDENDSYENIDELFKQQNKKVQSVTKAPPPRVPPRKPSTAGMPPKLRQNVAPANNETRLVGAAILVSPGSATSGSIPSLKSPPPGGATPGSSPSGKSPPSGSSPSGKSPLGGFGELYMKMKNSKKGTIVQKVLPMQADPSPFERPGIGKVESVVKPFTSPSKGPAHPNSKPKPVVEPVIPYTIHRKMESVGPRIISNPAVCSSEDNTESSSVNIAPSGWEDLNDLPPMDLNIAELSIDEVHRCVKMIGITGDKADLLKDANVDGTLLLNLDVDMLVNDFGFRNIRRQEADDVR